MSREQGADLSHFKALAEWSRDPNGRARGMFFEPPRTFPLKDGKGETRCNRTACQVELHIGRRWWNSSTRAFYCASCARRINEASPGLCFLET